MRPRTSGFCGRNGHDGFGAAHIFEAVIRAHGDGVLTRTKIRYAELVIFFWRVADAARGRAENPISAIDAILRAFDAGGGISRDEFHGYRGGCRRISIVSQAS